MELKKTSKFLNLLDFFDLKSWDVKRYLGDSNFDFENRTSLSEILIPFKQTISHEDVKKQNLSIISKIDFGGNIYLREKNEIDTYKGTLSLVPKNSIIYSKINVRHGCIYYNDKEPFVVSNEYPCFQFDENIVNGEFLILLLRSIPFKGIINTLRVGGGKARVKVAEFLSLEVPLPNKDIQSALVATFYDKIKNAEKLEHEVNVYEQKLDSLLGIKTISNESNIGSLSFVDFKEITKWGLDQIFSNHTTYDTKYKTLHIEQLCFVGSGGTPSRSIKTYYNGNIPWIKTGEVIDDIIYDTEEKITEEAIKNSSAKLYPKGSLVIAMYGQGKTRGRTAKLGVDATTNQACAVLYGFKDDVLVDYVWIYLMNEYDRLRALASGNNQPNLNAEMIKNYPVVIPPKEIQEQIIQEHQKIKEAKKSKIESAELLKSNAIAEFENAIFK